MKLLSVDFAIDSLEFTDRHGIFRIVRGCSLLGFEEFQARLNDLFVLTGLDGSSVSSGFNDRTTIAGLYKSNKLFKRHCDRCLELNGVDLDWLDSRCLILESLLFWHEDGAGLLVRLNSDNRSTEEVIAPSEKTATVYDVGAALLGVSSDLNKVLKQMETIPAKQVRKIMEARVKHIEAVNDAADPEAKKKKDFEKWASRMRAKQAKTIADHEAS